MIQELSLPAEAGSAPVPADRDQAPVAVEAAAGPTQYEWRAFRSPQRSFDKVLSRQAMAWLNAFPAPLRPSHLCARYPRVANRLALCWCDPVLTERLFEDFLIDKRGTRQGFPAPVASELRRLHAHHARHLFPTAVPTFAPATATDPLPQQVDAH
jgi:hypothetical protein